MKILVVCSGNSGGISPFIREQVASLKKFEVGFGYFLIKGKGFFGYLKNYHRLLKELKKNQYALIHAHYGLSGLLSVLQRKVPVIITFHGSDVNRRMLRILSFIASRLSAFNIFVNRSFPLMVFAKTMCAVIPCGVDAEMCYPLDKTVSRRKMNLTSANHHIILFSSSFNKAVKNYDLARKSVDLVSKDILLIELKGYSRDEVSLLMNASDLLLLTSTKEGSPQVIKEAMACNCPVVATDVGDIAWLFGEEPGYYLCSFDPVDVAAKLKMALAFSEKNGRTKGRDKIIEMGLDSETIAKRIISVYESVLEKNDWQNKNTHHNRC